MRRHPQENSTTSSPGRTGQARLIAAAILSLACCPALSTDGTDLAYLSLEELANIQITSVSKKAESLADAAASVYVITNSDLRRSGASSLAEALRLAPNLHVAQINAQGYAISARGFNSSTANKLLVLIDGRTVYTPLYSGVFWDAQDLMLDDVERIEVISGPGGTLWGTNAVNGVINVITRAAKDSQNGLLAISAGQREQYAAVRYGGLAGANGHFRMYAKAGARANTTAASGSAIHDGWGRVQTGFRVDLERGQDHFTVQGDASRAHLDQPSLPSEARVTGVNLLTRWNRSLAGAASVNVTAYYDRTERQFPRSYHQTLDIIDLQFQHTLQQRGVHSVVWGASYRYSTDRMDNGAALAFLPASLHQTWTSLFAQDEVNLGGSLRLTGGIRLEHNDYTGLEVLPNARLAWKPDASQLLWSSISRAVRAPSRVDRDLYAPATAPFILAGNTTFRSEIANVVELGYRAQPSAAISYSVTVFHADYDYLRTIERLASGAFTIGNEMDGTSSGIETWGTYQATPAVRLSAGWTALRQRLHLKPGSTDPGGTSGAGNDPAHTWQLRTAWDINANTTLDITLRHVGALPRPAVPDYHALDLRLGWKIRPGLELAVGARNLGGKHPEFGTLPNRSEMGSRAFLNLLWKR